MNEVNKDNVATADVADLREYGKEVMGKNFPPATKEENIRKAVAGHLGVELSTENDGDGAAPNNDANASKSKEKAAAMGAAKKPEGKMYASKAEAVADKVTINIPVEKGETGKNDIFLGWNGNDYQIQRGHNVDIPYGAYLALLDAVGTEFDQEEDGSLIPRDAVSVPVNLVNDPRKGKR